MIINYKTYKDKYFPNIENIFRHIIDYIMFIETDKNKLLLIEKNNNKNNEYIENKLKVLLSHKQIKDIKKYISWSQIKNIIINNVNDKNKIESLMKLLKEFKNIIKKKEISEKLINKYKDKLNINIKNNIYKLNKNEILKLIYIAYGMYILINKKNIYIFIENCFLISTKLNMLSKNKKLYVICPGDSPTKIVKFLQILNLCPNCIFINFPFSRGQYNEKTFKYVANFIPDNFDNIIILDLIVSGETISVIYNSLKYKLEKNNKIKTKENLLNLELIGICFSNIILNIYPNFKYKIMDNLNVIYSSFHLMNEFVEHKFIINIADYWMDWDSFGISEYYNSRCIMSNPEHIKINEDVINSYDSFGCNFFVYLMILSYKNYDIVKGFNFDNYFN